LVCCTKIGLTGLMTGLSGFFAGGGVFGVLLSIPFAFQMPEQAENSFRRG
jgi:hypothetical protein